MGRTHAHADFRIPICPFLSGTMRHIPITLPINSPFATLADMESEPVVPSAITFSDSKIRDSETGKLTLIGVFHQIKATEIPFVSPPFFATVFITNFHGSIRNLPVRMEIKNE